MKNSLRILILGLTVLTVFPEFIKAQEIQIAPAPLFRDPVYDGAADPVVFWNRIEKEWWMLYTQRRANEMTADVAFCYGNSIAIASSDDNGKSWIYRGTLDLEFERGHNTFWAPDVVYDNGRYHMFVAYIKGVRNHWSGAARMAHYTSENTWDWKFEGLLSLSSDDVIDGTLFKDKSGKWKMWYKDNSQSWLAESDDLYKWTWRDKPVIADQAHEGPKVFEFKGHYWMVTDQWAGMGVYRSDDLDKWQKQKNPILEGPSDRPEDKPSGAHGDVVIVGDQAYIFYFTHPGRKRHFAATLDADGKYPYAEKRSSIQVAELVVNDGVLEVKDRNKPFNFYLPDID
ncbi:family 43 glycosylhydrolase [Sunxiuqinia sp. A32]|uniref:family 43 glycosylhydrolase n=1 Tax=Sunxiuqinia sp. A32 TaxID=3461496 RepID=UPI004045686A